MTAPLVAVEDVPDLLAPRTVVLPRVNLLPPEIEERRRFRQVQGGLAGAVVAAVGLVGVLAITASGAVSDAQADLDTATAARAQLQAEAAGYRDVTAVYRQAEVGEALLSEAMGEEVRWSRFLNDLSLSVPDSVWLKEATFKQTPPTDPAAVGGGIGTASFTGVAFGHDDVSVWLESLATQKGYVDPYFTQSTESRIGTRKVVTFSSSTTITADALSGRYATPAGG